MRRRSTARRPRRLSGGGASSGPVGLEQPVADARLVADVARVGGIIAELLAQVADVDAEVVRLTLVRRAPHLAQQLRMGDHSSRMLCQEAKNGELLARQPDLDAGEVHAPARDV